MDKFDELLDAICEDAGLEEDALDEGAMDRYGPPKLASLVSGALKSIEGDKKEAARLLQAIVNWSGGTLDPRGRTVLRQSADNLRVVTEKVLQAQKDLETARKGLSVILRRESKRL